VGTTSGSGPLRPVWLRYSSCSVGSCKQGGAHDTQVIILQCSEADAAHHALLLVHGMRSCSVGSCKKEGARDAQVVTVQCRGADVARHHGLLQRGVLQPGGGTAGSRGKASRVLLNCKGVQLQQQQPPYTSGMALAGQEQHTMQHMVSALAVRQCMPRQLLLVLLLLLECTAPTCGDRGHCNRTTLLPASWLPTCSMHGGSVPVTLLPLMLRRVRVGLATRSQLRGPSSPV
jgi:hypothetical protein